MLNLNKIDLKAYNDYLKKFQQIKELADRFKVSPSEMIELFFGIGIEALKHTEDILKTEFESKLKEIFPDVNPDEIKKGLKIIVDQMEKK